VVKPRDRERARNYEETLLRFDAETRRLPGIRDGEMRSVYLEQLVESLRRIEYVRFLREEDFDPRRADPHTEIFDPLRAAVFHIRNRNFDEAFWLIFLFVHFGKHSKDGWRLIRDIYGCLGGEPWTWQRITVNRGAFRRWLAQNEDRLRNDGISRRFGNHRKYESLSATSPSGTAAAIESYIEWVSPPRTHQELIQQAHQQVGQNPRDGFDFLYRSMSVVKRFGRLAKFDYLTMLEKLGLAPIEPGSAYLGEATGPRSGARLLFTGDPNASVSGGELDVLLGQLDAELHVGMQVLEDSLCNWQKSPNRFISFRG
jgi:hypothetical protein